MKRGGCRCKSVHVKRDSNTSFLGTFVSLTRTHGSPIYTGFGVCPLSPTKSSLDGFILRRRERNPSVLKKVPGRLKWRDTARRKREGSYDGWYYRPVGRQSDRRRTQGNGVSSTVERPGNWGNKKIVSRPSGGTESCENLLEIQLWGGLNRVGIPDRKRYSSKVTSGWARQDLVNSFGFPSLLQGFFRPFGTSPRLSLTPPTFLRKSTCRHCVVPVYKLQIVGSW